MDKERYMLIVDDAELNRAILASQFEKDFRILEAENGKVALRLLRQYTTSIAVVMLDIVMPELDGIGVLLVMREELRLSTIPVIITSAADESEYRIKAFELGATEYIAKPIDPTLVRIRVESAISRSENERLRALNNYLLIKKEEEERYRDVLESTNTMVLEYDCATETFKFDTLIGQYLAGNYDDRSLWQILAEDHVAAPQTVAELRAFFSRTILNQQLRTDRLDVKLRSAAGELRWFRVSLVKKCDSRMLAQKLLITVSDVHDEVVSQTELRYLAEYDRLTGIYNRNAFTAKTRELFRENPDTPYAVVRFDIEKFKVINDVFGHDEGDRLLRYIAKSLRSYMHGRGMYGRIEGDVFALCIVDSEEELLRMQRTLANEILNYDLDFEIALCFGVYPVDDRTLPVETMLDRAAVAQKNVKGGYTSCIAFYDGDMRNALREEQEIVRQMNAALREGQFSVCFQPGCRLDTGEIIGAEALVRWNHPKQGEISPRVFLPIFERNGFIMKLDAFVWERVCRMQRDWIDRGRTAMPISVNISRVNVYNPNLCHILIDLVQKYRLSPSLLRLEVTELAYTENAKLLIDAIKNLHDAGFVTLLDDFGTGRSSINMLKEIPVDMLKVDLGSLSGKSVDGRDANVLSSLIRMAGWLNLPVIAEGVETEAQAAFLRSVGCREAQGFHFFPPLATEDYEATVDERLRRGPEKRGGDARRIDIDRIWSGEEGSSIPLDGVVGGVGIYELSQSGVLEAVRVNDEMLKITGGMVTADENGARDAMTQIVPEDRARLLKMFQNARASKNVEECDCRRVRADGRIIWLQSRARCLGGDESHTLYCVFAEDVSEQKELERLLREENAREAALNSLIEDDLFIYEVATDTLRYQARRPDGTRRETVRTAFIAAADHFEAMHPDDKLLFLRLEKRLLTTPESGAFEHRMQDGAGGWSWRRCVYRCMQDAAGKVRHIVGTVRNIDRELALENAMTAAVYRNADVPREERLQQVRAALSTLEGGICLFEANESMQVLYADARYRAITRAVSEPGTQSGPLRLFHHFAPADAALLAQRLREAVRGDGSVEFIYRPADAEGAERVLRFAARRVPCEGASSAVFLAVTSVLPQHRAAPAVAMRAGEYPGLLTVKAAASGKLPAPESEPIASRLLSVAADGTAVLQRSGERVLMTHVSPSFCRVIGLPQRDFDLFDMLLPADRGTLAEALTAADANGASATVCRQKRADGTVTFWGVRIRALFEKGTYLAAFLDASVQRSLEQRLAYSEERFKMVFEHTSISVWDYDFATHCISQTGHSVEMHGFETVVPNVPEHLIETGFVHPESAESFRAMYNRMFAGERFVSGIFRVRNAARDNYWYEHIRYTTVFDESGRPFRAIGMSEDVTARCEAERLYQREQQFKHALTPDVFASVLLNVTRETVEEATTDLEEDRAAYARLAFETVFEFAAEHVADNDDTARKFSRISAETLRGAFAKGQTVVSFEYPRRMKDRTAWTVLEIHLLEDPRTGELLAYLYLKDIDARKQAELKLVRTARCDAMTGLWNKAAAIEMMQDHLASADKRRMQAMIILDLDDFKQINDNHGHMFGDDILTRFARVLSGSFRQSDIVGRYGGDEFFAMLKNVTPKIIAGRMRAFYQRLEEEFKDACEVHASAGVACTDETCGDYTSLLRRADSALYRAKALGKNRYCMHAGAGVEEMT